MMYIISELSEARTQREVDKIVEKYIDKVSDNQRPKLCQWANNAKRRIARIEREKRKSYSDLLN